jgi:hypothetical protein
MIFAVIEAFDASDGQKWIEEIQGPAPIPVVF